MLLLMITAMMWAGNSIAGKLAVGEVSPLVVVFLRWAIVSGLMLTFYGKKLIAHWKTIAPHIVGIALMAAFGFTGFNALFYIAAHDTSALNIGILQGSVPMLVALGALFVFGDRITFAQFIGILFTLGGVIAIASEGNLQRLVELEINPGDGLMIIACVFYAGYTLGLRSRPKVPALVFFTVTSSVAAIVSFPLVGYEMATETALWPTFEGWLIVLYIALFPSFIAQIFFMRGVELIGPARAGLFVNLIPIFGAVFAVVLLGETFRFYHAAGLSLVLGGIWISEHFAAKAPKASLP
ncbi:DMT family transporter [Rhodobacteraceae bacterium RKSG542]|nr:DMT family transporter [Pseudovibrio flavus]